MPIITALETQQHDPERVNVYLDGEFGFGASAMVAMARNLREGRELSEEDVRALLHDDAVERAYAAALNFLSYRPRSRREIETYFIKRKTEPEIASAVVQRLERARLIDDRAFATYWLENRQTFRPRGSRALRLEMRRKGLESEVIDETLEGLQDEEELAYEAGLRKARSLSGLEEREFFRKLVAFLQRRGFSYEDASAATRRIYSEREDPSSGCSPSPPEGEGVRG
ncbi:MAG: RecX family transcriptional regulator [Chloroflexi bacterium]|nr:RecX family transcriptional regulator [Chloroflexota bacterium]